MDGTQARASVPSYLVWSIFNLLCCCFPLGVAAVVCSCRSENASGVGDMARAQEASRTAKILNIVGLVCGIILIIIVIVLQFAAAKH
ncbi:UNVERIFIED_CONTAM: hypothetical protein FKN15_076593 [Acipenser sinensis]|uniref:Dispanin subfamily A member 2b-like n=1 Tax=Acipenser oxyrinchus oxyrinchus TaxID=40147 RepID=A0AAD8CFI7_ACIOX|nr:dispanin subfamily A member 2b-like [Acipenser oxyrinchus oxyrinchus]KAK1150090.1 dispanin subfamily A member 2b-like [Acipenser oxyrinchus oxyrinchus]KAK1150102.1 dispanin subfamily A member 2b-like [Acipenser oxyrinchus oxyrinchus]